MKNDATAQGLKGGYFRGSKPGFQSFDFGQNMFYRAAKSNLFG
jgi:hypothetical protein